MQHMINLSMCLSACGKLWPVKSEVFIYFWEAKRISAPGMGILQFDWEPVTLNVKDTGFRATTMCRHIFQIRHCLI